MIATRLALWFSLLAPAPFVVDGPVAAQAIPEIAAPDRRSDPRVIVDARIPPYAAVGRLTGAMVCTGALVVDPRIVVTAAHCVVERIGQAIVSEVAFEPGYQFGAALGSYIGEVWAVGSLRQYSHVALHDASNDWAIVVLEHAAEPIRPLEIRRFGEAADKPLRGTVLLPAYGDDIAGAKVLAADNGCSVVEIIWESLLHDCVVAHGASGAPLLVREGDWYAVIGINRGAMAYQP